MIDIFILTYQRQEFTNQTIKYLRERTKTPYRSFIIDNGGNELFSDYVDHYIALKDNFGVHAGWNVALGLAESDYFITTDNDIYVPDLEPDWLAQMIKFMDDRPDYGAISMQPHVTIGAAGIPADDPEDVKEVNMCGAVMRIMRREAVWKAGGWDKTIEAGRNHEERTICSRLQAIGYKCGRTSRLRCYHPFGKGTGGNWGYPASFTPQMQKHTPELAEYVLSFDNPESYDPKTWLPK